MKKHLDFLYKEISPFASEFRHLYEKTKNAEEIKNEKKMSNLFISYHQELIRNKKEEINEALKSFNEEYTAHSESKNRSGTTNLIHRPHSKLEDLIGLIILYPYGIYNYISPMNKEPLIQFVGENKNGSIVGNRLAYHLLPFNYEQTGPTNLPYSYLSSGDYILSEELFNEKSNISIIDFLVRDDSYNKIHSYNESELGDYGVTTGDLTMLSQSERLNYSNKRLTAIIYPVLKSDFTLGESYFS